MFVQTAVFFDWPFVGPTKGKTVRFFDKVGHHTVTQQGDVFRIIDDRIIDPKGNTDRGATFTSQAEAEQWVRDHA